MEKENERVELKLNKFAIIFIFVVLIFGAIFAFYAIVNTKDPAYSYCVSHGGELREIPYDPDSLLNASTMTVCVLAHNTCEIHQFYRGECA